MVQGTILIDQAHCKSCQYCVLFCPKDVIAIDNAQLNSAGYHPAALVDPDQQCTGCAICATVCPDACITVLREPVAAKTVQK